MRTEEEIKERIKTLDELRKEFISLNCIQEALTCVKKIEMLEWVLESKANNE